MLVDNGQRDRILSIVPASYLPSMYTLLSEHMAFVCKESCACIQTADAGKNCFDVTVIEPVPSEATFDRCPIIVQFCNHTVRIPNRLDNIFPLIIFESHVAFRRADI
jgi:hypothetical protein